jgi:micrococcal nuclease
MRCLHCGSLRGTRRSRASSGGLAWLLGAWFAVATPAAHAETVDCALEPGPTRAVARVLDGETLALDDGAEVRLIGALSPRPLDAAADVSLWPPEREAIAELERLVLGRSVELAFAGRRTDRYGRLLAQVFVRTAGQRIWVQAHMLKSGHARAYSLPDGAACMDELLAQERRAREARLGLWDHAAYQIRSAERPRELLRWRSSFQIVEGRVVRVASVRGQLYLNFGDDWRQDFTAGVRSSERRHFEAVHRDLRALEGQRVRVRGWIERRAGPAIDVRHPSQIEIVEERGPEEPTQPLVQP